MMHCGIKMAEVPTTTSKQNIIRSLAAQSSQTTIPASVTTRAIPFPLRLDKENNYMATENVSLSIKETLYTLL